MTEPEIQELFKCAGIDDSNLKRREAIELLKTFGLEDYEDKRETLRKAFENIRFLKKERPLRIWLESLIMKSKIYAEKNIHEYPRQHNTFIQYYVMHLDSRKISRNQMINQRTVFRDLEHVLDKMMIFAYGLDGIRPEHEVSGSSKIQPHICTKNHKLAYIEYFIKSNKEDFDLLIKQAKEFLPDISEPIDRKKYWELQKQIKELFCCYNNLDSKDPCKLWMLRMAAIHKKFVNLSKDEIYIRQHKVFEMRYFTDQRGKEIADTFQISGRTVYKYVDRTIEDILRFLYGIKIIPNSPFLKEV